MHARRSAFFTHAVLPRSDPLLLNHNRQKKFTNATLCHASQIRDCLPPCPITLAFLQALYMKKQQNHQVAEDDREPKQRRCLYTTIAREQVFRVGQLVSDTIEHRG